MLIGIPFLPETQYNRSEYDKRAIEAAESALPKPAESPKPIETATEQLPEKDATSVERDGSNISSSDVEPRTLESALDLDQKKTFLQQMAFYDSSFDSGEPFFKNFLKP